MSNCPKCQAPLPARLKSGRVICRNCGWSDKSNPEAQLQPESAAAAEDAPEGKPKVRTKRFLEDGLQLHHVLIGFLILGPIGFFLSPDTYRTTSSGSRVTDSSIPAKPKPLTFEERLQNYAEADSTKAQCMKLVRSRLKNPRGSEFVGQPVSIVYDDNSIKVTGLVDATNGFGAVIRSSYLCDIKGAPDNPKADITIE